ncbi:tetratricopeptide repeat protein [Marinobacter daepoensis]|uniref:Ancillary SecYEG translocon subunit n=1 Tax=Marinobacter daepoensis TaxID=262077 RepID=A0ABS3BCG2_9GAMM|nr:tetratricopeptide repeat protein [Marinobacter daepoensis]MBN7769243.1 tetratricopeptide repeat protein [Marinobacter daepoensis]MBY6032095.1 tetratricopeptide repeat protein [Marinobacter daepoensis]MBY6077933.1 tetratricopeptide repeat protein [Marinobacter daepoensis]
MAELRTEEEQVQAIKDWWKNNGSSLLIGVGAALAIVFGWQAWQNHEAQQRAEAASQFANLLNAYSSGDEESANTVGFVAETLRDEHGDSAYAIYGNLVLARAQLVEGSDPAAAVESLTWALEKSAEHPALELVIRNRLARAQFAAGEHDAALSTIDGAKSPDAFSAIFSELKGDVLLAKGDQEGAREAYLAAREQSQQGRSGVLELKLSDLGVGEDA